MKMKGEKSKALHNIDSKHPHRLRNESFLFN